MPSKYFVRDFVAGYYYHIYNRGVNKTDIYHDKQDYDAFVEIMVYYILNPQGTPLSHSMRNIVKVPYLPSKSSFDLTAFCLMPNHFHLLVKQINPANEENSIMNFMKRLTIAYSMYHKQRYKRSGALLESKYKNILVENDSYLKHLSKYIHLNPEQIRPEGSVPSDSYPYSSCRYYLEVKRCPPWLVKHHILRLFSSNSQTYRSFLYTNPHNCKQLGMYRTFQE